METASQEVRVVAVHVGTEMEPEQLDKMAHKLSNILVHSMTEEVFMVLWVVSTANGIEAWRRIHEIIARLPGHGSHRLHAGDVTRQGEQKHSRSVRDARTRARARRRPLAAREEAIAASQRRRRARRPGPWRRGSS